jgi:ribonuclease P protein component
MNFNYPKNEKLKSKITIGLLFSEGKSVSKYPLRLVYHSGALGDDQQLKVGVSVSKKHFKKAVDRNYLNAFCARPTDSINICSKTNFISRMH